MYRPVKALATWRAGLATIPTRPDNGQEEAELVFHRSTEQEAEALMELYFKALPEELERFDNNPHLSILLKWD